MTSDEARKLLGGYATGTLTKTERENLALAALKDDQLFEELVREDDLLEVLSDTSFRQRLKNRLRQLQTGYRPPLKDRLFAMFRVHWLVPVSALAAFSIVLLIRQGVLSESSSLAHVVLGPGTIPALHAAGILETPAETERRLEEQLTAQPPKRLSGGSIGLDHSGRNPLYRVGDRQRIGFQLDSDSRVLLVEERADGSSVRLFPNRFQSSTLVLANTPVLVPPAGQGDLAVDDPPGQRILRLLVFPSGLDPLQDTADWPRLRESARLIEKRYEVKR